MWHKKMRLGIGFFLFMLILFAGYKSASCGRVMGEDIIVDKLDAAPPPTTPTSLSRSNFPAEFIFGTSSSAYQFEGAANEGGRGPSIWDTFVRKYPDKIGDHSTGKVATDSYHRYKEDVKEMKEMGFDAYRFSISWSRLLPSGKLSAGVNPEGLQYYNNLINELLANGLKPFVTLFHWDLPQALQDEYGGFLSPQIAKDFGDYAELCFREFGDRVKHWITVNEPFLFTITGYDNGTFAPGRCSDCPEGGDSATEPYTVAHHLLLTHATAVKIYRSRYQTSQKGEIGLVLDVLWTVPLYNSTADKMAASRALAFMYDWFMEPLHSGSYPIEMVKYVAERLPQFSKGESFLIKGSFDFIGINYYSATYVTNTPCQVHRSNYLADSCVALTDDRSGIPIGPRAASFWLYVYPEGIQEVLLYTKEKFGDPVLYITENGVDEANDGTFSLQDDFRIDYHAAHLNYVRNAIMKGANVKGYFVWSLLDNFEWADGYTVRFGLIYVDFNNGLRRYPKKSASWFKWFLRHKQLLDL